MFFYYSIINMNTEFFLKKYHTSSESKILIVPLKFNIFDDYSTFKNILLIDDKVINNIDFFNYVNQDTYPILYNITSTAIEWCLNFKRLRYMYIL